MLRYLFLGLFAMILLFGGGIGLIVADGNFHKVSAGSVYRSAQLSPDMLKTRIEQHHIRSILNLRGDKPRESWYEAEREVSDAQGVVHADFQLSAHESLNVTRMQKLIALMARLPKPMLIHCYGGADRSGLASALFLYAVKGNSAGRAAQQLSYRYGHIPHFIWKGTIAMDQSFWRFVTAQKGHLRKAMPNLSSAMAASS